MPSVSVVVPTHNRAVRLRALLASLDVQTLDREQWELLVVDDGSSDETPDVLAATEARVIRHERPAGPAHARNEGWQAANSGLIAFIDDDCVATPGWLEALVAAASARPGHCLQGQTTPRPDEQHRLGPFTRTIRVTSPGPYYETCNIAYPRDVLERFGGFDTVSYPRAAGGEDTDLAWRAIAAGIPFAWVPEAQVHHAVVELGYDGALRVARRWEDSMRVYARSPELRKIVFTGDVFWKPEHVGLVRAAVALALPRRVRFAAPLLLAPYLAGLARRARGAGPLAQARLARIDAAETATAWRGGRAAGRLML